MASSCKAEAGSAKQTLTITGVTVTRMKDTVTVTATWTATGSAWNASAKINGESLYSWSTSGPSTFQTISKSGTKTWSFEDTDRTEHTATFPFRCYVQYARSTTGKTAKADYTFTVPARKAGARVKVDGAWIESEAVCVKTGGAWIEVDAVYVKNNGSWEESA